jgi:hypothetical protein
MDLVPFPLFPWAWALSLDALLLPAAFGGAFFGAGRAGAACFAAARLASVPLWALADFDAVFLPGIFSSSLGTRDYTDARL